MAKVKNKISKKTKSFKSIKSGKNIWYKSFPARWSFFSVSIMGVLAIMLVVYGASIRPTVLGTTSTAYNCILIDPNNKGINQKDYYKRDYSTACVNGKGPTNGVYIDSKVCIPNKDSDGKTDYVIPNICQGAVARRPIYVKVVDATGSRPTAVNETSTLWIDPGVGMEVKMTVDQFPREVQTNNPTRNLDKDGVMVFYQYSSPISDHNLLQNTVHFSIFANASNVYQFDKKSITTHVGWLHGVLNPNGCGATRSEACIFRVVKVLSHPKPTPRVCKTSYKTGVCNGNDRCTEVKNSCSARISYTNCSRLAGYCGVPKNTVCKTGSCMAPGQCRGEQGRSSGTCTINGGAGVCCTF